MPTPALICKIYPNIGGNFKEITAKTKTLGFTEDYIASTEQVQDIISLITNGGSESKISDQELISTLTEVAISTKESQENILPNILDSIEKDSFNKNKKKAFYETILSALNSDMPDNILTEDLRDALSDYLTKQEPKLNILEDIPIENLENYYSWVNAISKVKNIDTTQYLRNTLFTNNNPLKVSSIILYANENTIQNIKKIQELKTRIVTCLLF